MNKTLKTIIIVGIVATIIIIAFFTRPLRTTKPEKILENKIESIENFRDEAEAMSVSLPLLNDSIVKVYSDSILLILTDLNKTWIRYMQNQEEYAKYTPIIGELNKSLETLLIKYDIEKSLRAFRQDVLKKMRDGMKNSQKERSRKNQYVI